METYEDVADALDTWLSERPGMRKQIAGKTAMGAFFCRLESTREKPLTALSDFSTNDATAKALGLAENNMQESTG